MVSEHYSNILSKGQESFQKLSNHQELYKKFISAHNDAFELESLAQLMVGRPEVNIYNLALLEYQHALYSIAFAQYRQAHVSLRLFLELSLAGVLFSAHEIDTHLWLKGQKDSNWNSIISNETGVFSKSFVGAFFEEMKEYSSEYLAMAAKVYRECSEFVHGNRSSFDGIDSNMQFNSGLIENWLDRAETVRILIKFSLMVRYLPHVSLELKNEFEHIAMDEFGSLAPIQSLYTGVGL